MTPECARQFSKRQPAMARSVRMQTTRSPFDRGFAKPEEMLFGHLHISDKHGRADARGRLRSIRQNKACGTGS